MGAQRQAAEFHDYPFETTDLVCDQAAAYASGSFEDSDHATLTIYVKDNIELRATYSVLLDRKCPQQRVCDLCKFASLWAVVVLVVKPREPTGLLRRHHV